jgi:glycosyltransferase involved in cell wall biosynthesis
MGKTVLSTSLGAEGLPARDGENIAIADSAEQMAARALALLGDRPAAERLAAAGRKTVLEQFAWQNISQTLLGAYEEVLARTRTTPSRGALTRGHGTRSARGPIPYA